MREHEVQCFAREIGCSRKSIQVVDFTAAVPDQATLDGADVVLLGGSGDFSVTGHYSWLEPAFETLRQIHDHAKPTLASCWGFQAFAKALGGEVVTDLARAELGTIPMRLTQEGKQDPIFGPLGEVFAAQAGHQDIVESLPADAVLLASSSKVENQAFTFFGKPIYCTQFHTELRKDDLMTRLRSYPRYIESIVGVTPEVFEKSCYETEATRKVVSRFVQHVEDLRKLSRS